MDSTEEITIKVSPKIAAAYHNTTEQEKQRLQDLVNLFLDQREFDVSKVEKALFIN